jgi:hypothetical protein
MIPKSFKLGGMDYQVLLEEVPGYRWRNFPPIQEVHLAPTYMGEELRTEIIIKSFWEATTCLVVDRVMLRLKPEWSSTRVAFGNLLAQVMMWLQEVPTTISILTNKEAPYRMIYIGGANIKVVIDNVECDKRKVYGEYDGNSEKIILQSEGVSEGVFMKHTPEFMLKVLIHECLHAICAQLGLEKTKWNTEHNINTMAFFFTEIFLTLKSKEIVEEYKDFKYTHPQLKENGKEADNV